MRLNRDKIVQDRLLCSRSFTGDILSQHDSIFRWQRYYKNMFYVADDVAARTLRSFTTDGDRWKKLDSETTTFNHDIAVWIMSTSKREEIYHYNTFFDIRTRNINDTEPYISFMQTKQKGALQCINGTICVFSQPRMTNLGLEQSKWGIV